MRGHNRLWLGGLGLAAAVLVTTWAAPALAISRVSGQSATGTSQGTSISATFAANPTAGNLIVAYVTLSPATTSALTIPTGFIQAARNDAATSSSIIYYAFNISGGASLKTLTFSGLPTGTNSTEQIVEYTGLDPNAPLDVTDNTGSGTVTTTTAASTGTINPTYNTELVVVGMVEDSQDGFSGATPATFTTSAAETTIVNGSVKNTADLWDEIVGSAASGPVTMSAFLAHSGTQNYSAAIASFHGPSLYWVGTGANTNFSNTANWATTSGGPGGAGPPGTGDEIAFDANGLVNCNVDQVVSVATMSVRSGYTNTIKPAVAGDTITTAKALSIASGTVNLAGSTLTVNGPMSVTGGTLNIAGGTATIKGGLTVTGGTLDVAAGSLTANTGGTVTISGGTVDADGGTVTFSVATTVSGGSLKATKVSGGSISMGSTLTVSGGAVDANGGSISITGATTMSSGSIAATSGSITFTGTTTLSGGTYDGAGGTGLFNSTTATTISGATFNVSTGAQTMRGGLTLSSGTLNMLSDGSTLYIGNDTTTRLFSITGGTFQVTGTTAATYPLITKGPSASGAGANYTFTISGGTLSLSGLRVQNADVNGMTISTPAPTGVTLSAFTNLLFTNNKGGTGSTHLKFAYTSTLTADYKLSVTGCKFDTTATSNVTATATNQGSQTFGAYFVFEIPANPFGGEGEARDNDGDSQPDGIIDSFKNDATIITWTTHTESDVAGTAVGFPTAAFDWNTFQFYSVYATFSGAATNRDRIYVRNADGSAHYSYDIDSSTYGNIIGTSLWDTVSETGTIDINGNGTLLEANIHVLYVSTTGGFIFKLIDNGSSLTLPGTGSTWHTPFPTSAPSGSVTVSTISTPLTTDRTNLYFGGTSSGNSLLGVQIASGGTTCNGTNNGLTSQEKCAIKYSLGGTPTAITASLATGKFGSDQYVYVASTNTIYRYDATTAALSSSFSTAGAVAGRLVLIGGSIWSADSGSKVNRLNADPTSGSGTFTNLTGFPFSATGTLSAPTVDSATNNTYVGNSAGTLYKVSSTGTQTWTVATGLGTISAAPLYVLASGYVIAGDTNGKVVYVLDNGSSGTLKYTLTLSGSVSAIAYNPQSGNVMLSTANGGFYYLPTSMP